MDDNYYKKVLKNEQVLYRNYLNLDKNITFGIEIEYENIETDLISILLLEDENKDLKKWINTLELDIGEYNKDRVAMNGEIISPILRDSYNTWKKIEKILNILDSKNAKITSACGGHVNIGSSILEGNPIYYRNLLLLWKLYSKYIHNFSSGEYIQLRKNGMVKRFNSNVNTLKSAQLFLHLDNDLFDKLHEVYIEESNSIQRIEYRIPNGSLNKEIWQNYINFFANFTLACKKELDVEKVVYKIKNNDSSAVELANYIFDDEFDKEQFLIQALKTNKIYKKELPNHIKY